MKTITVKEHPYYAGLFVTEDGEVFYRLKASPAANGYHTIKVPRPVGKPVTVRRHTLVLETFKGPADGRVARHGTLGPSVDTTENLCWGTVAENCADTVAHGHSTTGTKNARAKLTDAQALEVFTRYHGGESGAALAAEFGISQPSVVAIGKKRTWAHLHK